MNKINSPLLIIFLLFWAIPFPMLMYYNLSVFSNGSSAMMAFAWLAVALLFSIIILIGVLKKVVLYRFIAIRKVKDLLQNGDLKSAKIIQSTLMPAQYPGIDTYKVVLELQNFVGTTIRESMLLYDDKKGIYSFDVGRTIKVRVDKTLQNVPYLQLDGARYNGPTVRGLVLGSLVWLVVAAMLAGYYVYAYQHQNNGTGWRFLEWDHPLIICQALLIVMSYFFSGGKLTKNQLLHKYYGYETQAQVIGAAQNGIYINNQPQVKFELQFTDKNNKVNNASFIKTIGVLDVAFAQQKTMDIFYLENDPQNICMASELEPKI